mmetsp:Transcript_40183/g.68385  ORF Transcript_40183/g.68385 Transcript_40183/m.68385 type:complete len:92 (+) Transcript_40183:86-361(+)
MLMVEVVEKRLLSEGTRETQVGLLIQYSDNDAIVLRGTTQISLFFGVLGVSRESRGIHKKRLLKPNQSVLSLLVFLSPFHFQTALIKNFRC